MKEFDAFIAAVKEETPEFYRKNFGNNPERAYPEAHKHLRPGMAEKDANELLSALATVFFMDAEAKFMIEASKVSVEGDTAKIEGDDLHMEIGGKTTPGQEGAAFVMKYVDGRWYVAEMTQLY